MCVCVCFSKKTKYVDNLDIGSAICLHNDPAMTVDAPFCGDYMVNQDSEQCDCGSVDTCEDPCCHPENCTLKEGNVKNVLGAAFRIDF